MAKACKHPAELEGMRQAHIRDGAALTAFLAWLEQSLHDHAAAKNNGCGKTQPKHY
jgi:Xaa-Pro aminopeptidase